MLDLPNSRKKSLIGEKYVKGNIHRHTLGQKSYNRKRPDWEKEKRLPPPPAEISSTESSVMSRKVQNRALEWCLAHQLLTRDGKWEVDPSKVETTNVVSQVMEYLEKESKEKKDGRASSSEIDNDALSKALGQRDYYGYVKGVGRCGVGVGYRKAFGKEIRKYSKPPQQQPTVEVPKKCRLAVMDNNGNLVVVADGTCHPSEAGVLHSSRLLLNHYIVSIDNPYVDHNTVELPVASPDGPMSMVLFDDAGNEKRTTSQSKEGVGSCDPLRELESERTPLVPGGDTKTGELNLPEFDLLQMLMVEDNHQSVRVTFKAPSLYLKEDQEVWVTSTDIDEVVRRACINVSVIHVYIRNHWILMAIDLCDGIMYQYDPLPLQEPRQLSCENVFDIAYKSYRARIKENTKIVLDVIRVECAQQTGGTDCGYYVMKYMHYIVKKVIECKGDVKQIKDYTTRSAPYSKGELDEIREQ